MAQAIATSLLHSPGPLNPSSGQHPLSIPVVQANGDQPAQVDRGHLQRQTGPVAGQAAVTHPTMPLGDQPGDRALYHRPPAPIGGLEAGSAARRRPPSVRPHGDRGSGSCRPWRQSLLGDPACLCWPPLAACIDPANRSSSANPYVVHRHTPGTSRGRVGVAAVNSTSAARSRTRAGPPATQPRRRRETAAGEDEWPAAPTLVAVPKAVHQHQESTQSRAGHQPALHPLFQEPARLVLLGCGSGEVAADRVLHVQRLTLPLGLVAMAQPCLGRRPPC
jgi:hypothetical protein